MTKKYALLLIIILLLPTCAVRAASLFPVEAGQQVASGTTASSHPCHEAGSETPEPSAPVAPDCCVRPVFGQAERDSDLLFPAMVMPDRFVSDDGLITDVESRSGGSEFFAKYRRKNDLSGIVMRN